jgi:glucosamine--fructose-6-phosphate aminotransferase (isomerizing)
MCGIIGIVSRPSGRAVPTNDHVLALLDRAVAAIPDVSEAAVHVIEADLLLRGDAGIQCLAGNLELIAAITSRLDVLDGFANDEERRIDSLHTDSASLDDQVEQLSRLRDGLWAIRRDRIRTAQEVHALAGRSASVGALCGYLSIQQALSAIDRMEVRGRDSAGISVLVFTDAIAGNTALERAVRERGNDPLFTNNSVRLAGNCVVFVYKAAAEIGELGDNTRAMRAAVHADDILRVALALPGARVTVLGHTRWASVGIISEPNAHPVTGEEVARASGHMSVAALNGDVDNHGDLRARFNLSFADPITTDAKVIPALVDRYRDTAPTTVDAFREAVNQFEGSVAIAYCAADEPDTMYLALHGSGQGMCVGMAEDRFVVASEPYGVVEETQHFIRMDGEALADPTRLSSRGQIMVLRAGHAGHLDGVDMVSYEGATLPLTSADVHTADVTTRDIDRGDAPHFLLKEIGEAPNSFRKTLRGRIGEHDGMLVPELDESTLPAAVIAKLRDGSITRVRVIGQGTAAIAGRAMVAVLDSLTDGRLQVDGMTATELSGFAMHADMSDMLVVAVSQSGTTTDTNRTVDLVATRGASVLAIVNRRGSELANKAHGVYYTSDGRDIEMSVASTKAFYAQVAAGIVLSCAIAREMGMPVGEKVDRILESLRDMPHAMDEVLKSRADIARIAQQFAPSRRYWAVVGNGPNAVAANEVRIKLSELCYKSISCDVTEDKKHIDLSCEPMIMVCAAGLGDGTATDVAKEVAIYRAHKAIPIVIATEGESRFDAASAVVSVPRVEPSLAFILSAMVGHLFGYEAALAIDALARPLRQAREAIEHVVERGGDGDDALARVAREIVVPAQHFMTALHTGEYNGNLEASTAVKMVNILNVVTGANPLGDYQRLTGRVSSPASLLDDLLAALTKGIDELTRPIDAIKHQAKTVTVGISRSEEGLLDRELVKAVIEAGVARDRLSYATLKVLADLDVAVASVNGFTRYRIEGEPATGGASIFIVERGGLSRDLSSRVDSSNVLVGTKRRVANDQQVLVARGRSDGRTVILVPETKGSTTTGITLLHVNFHDRLPVPSMRRVLQGYDQRYDRLVDWVTETEGSFREDRLAEVSVADMLINPVSESANAWCGQ